MNFTIHSYCSCQTTFSSQKLPRAWHSNYWQMTRWFLQSTTMWIVFLTSTTQRRSNAKRIISSISAKILPLMTPSTQGCFCAARHSSTGSNQQKETRAVRCRTVCANLRVSRNCEPLISTTHTGRTSTAPKHWLTPKASLMWTFLKTRSRRGWSMLRIPSKARLPVRLIAIAMSAGFFLYLIWRSGPSKLWKSLSELGWGIILVIALAGVSHLARTWGWRLTLGDDQHKISFSRLVGLRLGAEAAGQLGILGQTLGDSVRVSRMSAEIPVANGLASVTLDRGLYVVTGIVTTIAGILAALPLVALSHALRLYASLFALTLIAFLMVTLFAVRKRWPVLSWSARIISRVPSLKNWMEKRYLLVQSVENALFDFYHKTPGAFCASFSLNLAAQCLAVSEVCLILWLMDLKMGFFSALVIEALTKLVNVLGNFNPGNIGTYEGGTMLIGKMFGLSSPTGLALGLSRRLRSFFWAAVGLICSVLLTRSRRPGGSKILASTTATVATSPRARADSSSNRSLEGEIA